MARHVVARAADVRPGERLIVEVEGRSIGIFNIGGEFFALRNRCPHAGAELCTGSVSGLATAKVPGKIRLERPGEFLRCPWHHWEFDIRTGRSWFDPARTRVKAYEIDVEPGGDGDLASGPRPGPHVAERYDVEREGDVLVLDTSSQRRGTGHAR